MGENEEVPPATGPHTPSSMQPQNALEESIRQYLRRLGQSDPDQHTKLLLARGGYEDRFQYFSRFLQPEHRRLLLVSGAGAGTEMLVAKDLGFDLVLGTEVGAEWARFSAMAVKDRPRCGVVLYDGACLPLRDGSITAIASGHIIEHTADARQYLHEHLRALCRGGVFFLEFPDRYHPLELHTNLPSFEWAPPLLRRFLYRRIAEAHSKRLPQRAALYSFIDASLQPVGVPDVFEWLASSPAGDCRVRHYYRPLPGYVRMILTRRPDGAPAAAAASAAAGTGSGQPPAGAGRAGGASADGAAAGACLQLLERMLHTVLEFFAAFQLAPAGVPPAQGQASEDDSAALEPLPSEPDMALRHLALWAERALAALGGPEWPVALSREPHASRLARLLLDYEAAVCERFGGRPLPSAKAEIPHAEPRPDHPARGFWRSLRTRLQPAWRGLAAAVSRSRPS